MLRGCRCLHQTSIEGVQVEGFSRVLLFYFYFLPKTTTEFYSIAPTVPAISLILSSPNCLFAFGV